LIGLPARSRSQSTPRDRRRGRKWQARRPQVLADKEYFGVGIIEHIGHFGRCKARIHANEGGTCFSAAEHQFDIAVTIGGIDRDTITGPHTQPDQAIGHAGGACIEFAKGGATVLKHVRDGIRAVCSLNAGDIGNGLGAVKVKHGVPQKRCAIVLAEVRAVASSVGCGFTTDAGERKVRFAKEPIFWITLGWSE
jgi:hypothetical protein